MPDKTWEIAGYSCMLCGRNTKSLYNMNKHMRGCIDKTEKRKLKELKKMPIQRIVQKGEVYYRWGDHGKLYKDRADAEKQAVAAYASGYKEPNKMQQSNMKNK